LLRTVGARKVVPINERLPAAAGILLDAPVTGEITLTNTGTVLLVSGRVKTVARLQCSRCLDEYSQPVEAEVQEEFRLIPGGGPEGQTTADSEYDEDLSTVIGETEIDLTELMRQALLVSLPFQPLCRQDCKGLCPNCGKNRNREECSCTTAPAESPFSKLASLLGENGERE